MPLTDIPEPELAKQAMDALEMFIKFSNLWLENVPSRPDTVDGRKMKNRMWNANVVSQQMLARLNDEILDKWTVGHHLT